MLPINLPGTLFGLSSYVQTCSWVYDWNFNREAEKIYIVVYGHFALFHQVNTIVYYGYYLGILWSPLKNETAMNFTIANLRAPMQLVSRG